MGSGQKDSISASVKKSEVVRNSTRDFYINCFKLFNEDAQSIGSSNGMNRYYQIKVNSTLNLERDDVNYLLKVGERNTRCIRCGNDKKIKLESRRNLNKSASRKYCSYLSSFIVEYCDRCNISKRFRNISTRKGTDKLSRRKNSPKISTLGQKEASTTANLKTKSVRKPKGPEPSKRLLGSIRSQHSAPPSKKPNIKSKITNNLSKGSRTRAFSCLLK